MRARLRPAHGQRGWVTMSSGLAMVAGMVLLCLLLSRITVAAQRLSANSQRQLQAFEAAEAGLEWAVARLNDPRSIDERCESGGTIPFRNRYLPYQVQSNPLLGAYAPITAKAACAWAEGDTTPALNCSCPAAGDPRPLLPPEGNTPVFSVSFQALSSSSLPGGTLHGEAVLLNAWGCSSADARCLPGYSGSAGEGFQKASIIVKLLPALLSAPAAAITSGGPVDMRSAPGSRAVNTDTGTQGIVLNAGGALSGPLEKVTIAGKPADQAVVVNDAPLAQLAQPASIEPMLRAYFGTGLQQLKLHPATRVLGEADCAGDCSAALQRALAEGWRVFLLEAPLRLADGAPSLGTATDPVILVSSSRVLVSTAVAVNGLVLADEFNWIASPTGGGSAGSLQGALLTRQGFAPTSNASYTYRPDLLTLARGRGGSMLRVAGSWKDF